MTPPAPPNLSPLVAGILNTAQVLAPKQDEVWIRDMRFEAPFVPNKLSFALATLRLALKFRLATWKLGTPVGIAFASFAVAALATFLFVPRIFAPSSEATLSVPAPNSASVEDIASARGMAADAQPEASAPLPSAQEPGLQESQPQGTVAEAVPPAPAPTAPTTMSQEPLAQAKESAPEPVAAAPVSPSTDAAADSTLSSDSTDSESTGSDDTASATYAPEPSGTDSLAQAEAPETPEAQTETQSASEESTHQEAGDSATLSAVPSSPPSGSGETTTPDNTANSVAKKPTPGFISPPADAVVLSTEVKGTSVKLEVIGDALLTIYNGSDFSGTPRVNGYVTRSDLFTATVPFSLYTDNASAIKVTVDGSSFVLGEDVTEQFRVFNRP